MKERSMRREGSALHGLGVVMLKEIADHFSSIIIVIGVAVMAAIAVFVVSMGIGPIKDTTAEDPFLFLLLFTRSSPLSLPVLLSLILVPALAIVLVCWNACRASAIGWRCSARATSCSSAACPS
jgi:ABC-2 type transport system permease protein